MISQDCCIVLKSLPRSSLCLAPGETMLLHPTPAALAAAIFAPHVSLAVDKNFLPPAAWMERPSAGKVTPPCQQQRKPPP